MPSDSAAKPHEDNIPGPDTDAGWDPAAGEEPEIPAAWKDDAGAPDWQNEEVVWKDEDTGEGGWGNESSEPAEKKEPKEKKEPYINPDRHKTGGTQREKISEDELSQRMARIREANEKIKQRRIDVKADEDAFKESQAKERAKREQVKKVQANVDRAREQNARRKMDKAESREWDSGKPSHWKAPKKGVAEEGVSPSEEKISSPTTPQSPQSPRGGRGNRAAPRARGRGRGGGRGGPPTSPPVVTDSAAQLLPLLKRLDVDDTANEAA